MKKENEIQSLSNDERKIDAKLNQNLSEEKFWACLNESEIINEVCMNKFGGCQIFVSGLYNSTTDETAAGFVLVGYKHENSHFEVLHDSYFYPVMDLFDDGEASDITAELEVVVNAIFYCSLNGIHDAVIHYNHDATWQWLSGRLLTDSEHLSDLRKEITEDIERLDLRFSKISSPCQIIYSGIANKLAKKAIVLENCFI